MDTVKPGRDQESQARTYLESKGYRFLAANYQTRRGELDLVMQEDETVVFVEVKSRSNLGFARPEESVTPAKQSKLAMAALAYVKENGLSDRPLRFDVVAIGPGRLDHLENAFEAPGEAYTL